MIGVEDEFAVVGCYGEVIDYYGLTGNKIASVIANFIENL